MLKWILRQKVLKKNFDRTQDNSCICDTFNATWSQNYQVLQGIWDYAPKVLRQFYKYDQRSLNMKFTEQIHILALSPSMFHFTKQQI